MRLLISGDPHLKISTIETAKKFLLWFEEAVVREKPEGIIIMGDLFDTHSIMRVEILWLWRGFFQKMRALGYNHNNIWILVGNHDQVSPGSEQHALVALEQFADIIDTPTAHGEMFFVPYVHTAEDFADMLVPIRDWMKNWAKEPELFSDGKAPGPPYYLFCHQTFQGALYENGFYDPAGFPLELVADFKLVISGHVHKVQKLGNVLYVGSPYHAGFADAGEKKALWIFNSDTGKMEKTIMNPLPKYHVLPFSEGSAFFEAFATASPEDHFKVVFSGGRAQIQAIVDGPEFKALKKKFKLNFVPEFTDSVNREARISENTSMEGMLDAYVSGILATDLDKPRLLSLSKAILSETSGVK